MRLRRREALFAESEMKLSNTKDNKLAHRGDVTAHQNMHEPAMRGTAWKWSGLRIPQSAWRGPATLDHSDQQEL